VIEAKDATTVIGGTHKWSGPGWTVSITATEALVTAEESTSAISTAEAATFDVRRQWFRWNLLRDGQRLIQLRGITKPDALAMRQALRVLGLTPAVAAACAWHATSTRLIDDAVGAQRWITTETVDELLATRPPAGLHGEVRAAGCEQTLTAVEAEAVASLDTEFEVHVRQVNDRIMGLELISGRRFFDTIEKSPLTDEQARAVICFDSRVQVLAAAGSGKTSVMVARAAYAVDRGFVPADRILLLAFNRNAAAELQERVAARFAAAGIDAEGLRASTFHSFGLDVIGRATGEKPRLASWLDQGGDTAMVMRIVDELRDSSEAFRYRWDLYRLLFANAPTDLTENEPDGYDRETSETGYRTFGGEVVKSHGERLVANFLFLNGVTYEYERPYDINVADAAHSQYRPDFYYPSIGVWHEHWAIGPDGQPPASFRGYADDMEWKRDTHAANGTRLIESTWAGVLFGSGLEDLKAELTKLGVTFDWNPDRPLNDAWAKPMKHEGLARLVRTFMAHVKSNSWTAADLDARLGADQGHLSGFRTRLFLDVYWQIHDEWQRRLAADRSVDFEDMLVQAAEHLEAGGTDMPYDLIMVDEFQDASRARARLVRGLVRRRGKYLLAVGDDWQAINRFAGADLSVMTGFEGWFGRGPQLALTTTFRCPQTICDVASAFVSKNPAQFTKEMRSAQPDPGSPVTIIRDDKPAVALTKYLTDLSAKVANGTAAPGTGGAVTVDVLGRYGFERDNMPPKTPANLKVTFRTVHGAKGLEADYIVIPGMNTGNYGFPSKIADDPVLGLAMPAPEAFSHAEERRLLYVALTRARRQVTLITPIAQMSPFAIELLQDPRVVATGGNGEPVEICSRCGQGSMVPRPSKYGRPWVACSTFPACTNKRNL
jgi:DNA helicase-4